MNVVRGTFAAPDGSTFTRDVVRTLGAVAVVPLLDDGETVLLVRQYRGPLDALLLEIPAGLLDVEGEDPADCARRELVEEVGCTADEVSLLAHAHVAAGISDHTVTIYLGTGLTEVGQDRQGPEEEHMTVERLSLREGPRLVAAWRLTDGKTFVCLLEVWGRLGGGTGQ